jgi:hypothetical protein
MEVIYHTKRERQNIRKYTECAPVEKIHLSKKEAAERKTTNFCIHL